MTLLRIIVKPNSAKDSIVVDVDGTIRVKIRAQPVDGKANKYLMEYLAKVFNLPKSKIEITKGGSSLHKTIMVNADVDFVKDVIKTFAIQK